MPSRGWNICKIKFLPTREKVKRIDPPKVTTEKSPNSSISSSHNNVPSEPIQWISLPADREARVHGFDSEIMSLKMLIGIGVRAGEERDKFKAVGVVGTCGVGKTTLCRELYRRLAAEEVAAPTFSPRIWVSMPKPPQKAVVLERILKGIGFEQDKIMDISGASANDDDHKRLMALLYILRLHLLGKKYLIVLDDMQRREGCLWYENLFKSVPLPSSKLDNSTGSPTGDCLAAALPKASGGTVIVTSREERTAKSMVVEDGNLHHLLPLVSDPKSLLEIFTDAVNKFEPKLNMDVLEKKIKEINSEELQFGKNIDMKKILFEKVVSKCNGLPLAAILMAATMPEQVDRIMKHYEKVKAMKGKEAQDKGEPKKKIEEHGKGDAGGDVTSSLSSSKDGKVVQDDQGGPEPGPERTDRGQESGKSKEQETSETKEEKEQNEEVGENEEAKETEEAKHDEQEDDSRTKDDQKPPKKDEEQKAEETRDHEVEAPKQEEETPKEAKETQAVQGVHEAEIGSPKKDEDQKAKKKEEEAKEAQAVPGGEDHGVHESEIGSPKKDEDQKAKKEEETAKEARDAQTVQGGEDHGVHGSEIGSPKKDEDQKAKKEEKKAPKEVKETQVQAQALEKKEELPEKKEHVQEEAKAAS